MRAALFALVLLALAGPILAAEVAPELPVLAKKEVTLKSRTDSDVASKELWYTRFDGKAWGAWEKHGLTFAPTAPVVWAAPEGHWRTYIRIIELNGASMPEPGPDAHPVTEFIIDRTAPTVQVQSPPPGAKLRGGQSFVVRWTASDPNIAPTPVAVLWSRTGDKFEPVADKLPNTGTYEWTVPKDMTDRGVVRIQVADKAGNVGAGDSGKVLVDSIAPSGRAIGPTVSASLDVAVAVDVKDAGPAGLSSAQLWVSSDDGQSWNEGPEITEGFKSISWKAPRDGRYRLAVVATDQAGNVSPAPRGKADDQLLLLVDTQKPVVTLASATGISVAGDEHARTSFKPGDRVQVQFTVKDAELADNPISVYLCSNGKDWVQIGKDQPADAAFRFEIPAKSDSRNARIRVTAIDRAGNVGETVSSEGVIIRSTVDTGTGGLEP